MAAALALTTSLLYGVANYVGPRLARDSPALVILIVGQTCSLILAGLVVAAQGKPAPDQGALAAALLAGLGNAGGLLLFYRATEFGPLSIVTPIGAFGTAVPVVSGLAGGEALTALKAAGIVLALTGLVLVARRRPALPEPGAVAGADAAAEHRDRRHAVLLALGSAAFFGVVLAAMAPASEDSAGWAVLVSRASLVAALVIVAARARTYRAARGLNLARLAVPGILLFCGTLSYAAATREGDLSVVSVLGSLFTVVTVTLALGLDRERLAPSQAAGVAAAIAGVIALSTKG